MDRRGASGTTTSFAKTAGMPQLPNRNNSVSHHEEPGVLRQMARADGSQRCEQEPRRLAFALVAHC
jgi:hypothetical protein